MSKKPTTKTDKGCAALNPVAKNAFKFNKAHTIPDKRQYSRKVKHNRMEPFIIQPSNMGCIIKGFVSVTSY